VQDQELSRVAGSIRDWAQSQGIPAYNEKTLEGYLRHVLLRKGAGTGEILAGLVTNSDQRPAGMRAIAAALLDRAARALKGSKSAIVGVVQNVNTRQTNVVLGEREFVWWGRPFLFERLGAYKFKAGLSTFFQVNPFQTPVLYDEVLKWIEPGSRVLDVYCGVGSIALWVSRRARQVTGIEENAASVAAAKKTAEVNCAGNVRFVKGDAGEQFARTAIDGYDVAVFDPPRKGLESSIIADLLNTPLGRIIYVSCNPETLSRDVEALLPAWDLISLQGVDMFPHTSHLECVAVLDKRG
jgi:23S rRNA (uracil1939-C5)-methyltransferase